MASEKIATINSASSLGYSIQQLIRVFDVHSRSMPCSYSGISSSVFQLLCTNRQKHRDFISSDAIGRQDYYMWEWLSGLEDAVNATAESIMSYVSGDVTRTDDCSNCLCFIRKSPQNDNGYD